ncbi:MARVEL domain-containing protein sing isoform X1 [Ptiloglossa arizonensis]|uniref:MARVEL domain-containing protein sing isoform X1 n=1 Tax=Ptiloglossa arizonensis TaxID=3350558 RepID=UPI003F9F4E89
MNLLIAGEPRFDNGYCYRETRSKTVCENPCKRTQRRKSLEIVGSRNRLVNRSLKDGGCGARGHVMGRTGAGPMIRMSSSGTHAAGGVACCFCRCCTCIHVEFLKTMPGMLKLCEAVISGLIQSLLINYGLRYSTTIGSAFEGSLTTSSACFLTSAVLLACYIVSEKSYKLIRSSLFVRRAVHRLISMRAHDPFVYVFAKQFQEMMFNALASFLYLSSASYLAFSTKVFLLPEYYVRPGFDVYPAMTAAYMMSGFVGILHGVDAYISYVHYRTGR